METQQQAVSDQASDSAEAELAQFVKDNYQKMPAVKQPSFDHLTLTPNPGALEEREKREAERAAAKQRSEIMGRAMELIESAGERYRGCTLESFDCQELQQRRVVAALRDYLNTESHDNVILYGPVGTGKDHLAFALCKSAVKSGRTVRWINGQKWFGIVRDAMDTDRSEASLISDLARADVLCLSDPLPPVGSLTQFQATMLYRVVDARYSKGLPTVCTINVATDAEADERMGPATWDRLCHSAWKLFCNWESFRVPKREV